MQLSELSAGQQGVIVKVAGHGGFRKRMVTIGLAKGQNVYISQVDLTTGMMTIRLNSASVQISVSEASRIEVISILETNDMQTTARLERRNINVALIGTLQSGSTTLLNEATGLHEKVGDNPEGTLEVHRGTFEFQGYTINLIDLPGVPNLNANTPETAYIRNVIIDSTPDVIINVVNTTRLSSDLFLTTQLLDMNVRMVIALNQYDLFEQSGSQLDYATLSRLTGTPMIPTVCSTRRGIEQLFHVLINVYEGADFLDNRGVLDEHVREEIEAWHRQNVYSHDHAEHLADFTTDHAFRNHKLNHTYRHIHVNHGPRLERQIEKIQQEIAKNEAVRYKYSTRFLAIKLLEKDKMTYGIIQGLPNVQRIVSLLHSAEEDIVFSYHESSEQAIADAKRAFIQGAMVETLRVSFGHRFSANALDRWFTHPVWGYFIFFVFLFLTFELTYLLGEWPMYWIDEGVKALSVFLQESLPEGMLKDMVINGIVGGVGGVIVFLPNIILLYLFISMLEDTGYLSRGAFIMDKVMHRMGLHGKSFIPLVMGFGCNTPAILAAHSIESKKSRLITMLVTPFMSCSARMPLYVVICGSFFAAHASIVMLSIYILGILMAVLSARLLGLFIMKGDDTPFVMELPPYRIPSAMSLLAHTWEKASEYLKKMGGVIMVASIIIWALGYFPHNDKYSPAEQQEHSYIGYIGRFIEPALRPCGFDWRMDIGLVAGTGAKELVVSTLGVLYSGADGNEALESEESADSSILQAQLRNSVTPAAGLSYMIFVLLYFPCLSTLGAIRKESRRWSWAIFSAVYTTTLAWCVSTLIYHLVGYFIG